jgi:hypothetical protein
MPAAKISSVCGQCPQAPIQRRRVNVPVMSEDRAVFTADGREKVEENACSWLQTSRILRIKEKWLKPR